MTPANESGPLIRAADPLAACEQLSDGKTVTPPDAIRKDFARNFASSAFRQIDGQNYIVGKYGRISQFRDGMYDTWFIGPGLAPLSGRRTAQIIRWCRAHYPQAHILELDGEAVCTGMAGRQFVLDMAALAGVRKKRQMTATQRASKALILARARTNRNERPSYENHTVREVLPATNAGKPGSFVSAGAQS